MCVWKVSTYALFLLSLSPPRERKPFSRNINWSTSLADLLTGVLESMTPRWPQKTKSWKGSQWRERLVMSAFAPPQVNTRLAREKRQCLSNELWEATFGWTLSCFSLSAPTIRRTSTTWTRARSWPTLASRWPRWRSSPTLWTVTKSLKREVYCQVG